MVLQGCLFLCLAIVLSSYRTCCLPLPAGYDYNPTCAWDISPPFLVYLRNSKCWEIATHFIAYITNRTLLMWCKMAKYVWHHGGLFFSRKVTDVFFSSINDIFFTSRLWSMLKFLFVSYNILRDPITFRGLLVAHLLRNMRQKSFFHLLKSYSLFICGN